jgi:hypothetical protein
MARPLSTVPLLLAATAAIAAEPDLTLRIEEGLPVGSHAVPVIRVVPAMGPMDKKVDPQVVKARAVHLWK